MLDYIPLCEVTCVQNLVQNSSNFKSSKRLFEQAMIIDHGIEIHTAPDGYNSGRKYILQVDSETELNQLVVDIKRLANRASKKTTSAFQRRKMLVRRVYNSNAVQSIASLLIALVRC